MSAEPPRAQLESIFRASLRAVEGGARVADAIERDADGLRVAGRPLPRGARLQAIAAGKAAAGMAAALEAKAGDALARGLCITKHGHGRSVPRFEVREAGHPVPDAAGVAAARAAAELLRGAPPQDVVVLLLSGGASALLSWPVEGVTPEDLAHTTDLLLRAGAGIEELNTVRKHLGRLFGGRLAELAAGRAVEVLALSDVAGDRLDVIGSGPCAGDPSSFADALAVLEGRGLSTRVPASVRAVLEAGARGELPETPEPGDAVFERVHSTVLASNDEARAAAGREAETWGLRALDLGDGLHGEAREEGRRLAALAGSLRGDAGICLVAGGEPTVTVEGCGLGGRCQELALAAALELEGSPHVQLLAAGTDGTDGPTEAAGAFVDGGTLARGAKRGVDARERLTRNDSHGFFAAEGGLLRTGPTGTNVRDLVLVRVVP